MPTHPSHYEPGSRFEDSHGGRSKNMPETTVTTQQAAAAFDNTGTFPLNLPSEILKVRDLYGAPLAKALIELTGAKKVMDVPPESQYALLAVAQTLNTAVATEKPTGPYAELKRVFDQAFTGQTEGKAKARHNKTGVLPFEQQRIMSISETQNSPYGLTYQVTKKMLEALDMDEVEKTLHELQGVMVYVGALILYVERQELRRKTATMRPSDFGAIGD